MRLRTGGTHGVQRIGRALDDFGWPEVVQTELINGMKQL